MKHHLLLFLISISLLSVGCKNEKKIDISDELKIDNSGYYIPQSRNITVNDLKKKNISFIPLKKMYQNFGEQENGVWYKCDILNNSTDSTFVFITRGVDSLRFYLITNHNITDSSLTGGHYNPNSREFNSSFTTFKFNVLPSQKTTLLIFAKNVNYKLSLFPFTIKIINDTKSFIANQQLFHSFYIGAMVILLLFGFTLFLLFRDTLYLFYSIGVGLSLGMMIVNFDYFYLITGELPEVVRNKNIYGFFTTVLPLNYFLFAQKFLKYDAKTNIIFKKITPLIAGITLSIVFIFLYFNISIFQYRLLFEVIVFILCILPLILLYKSFRYHYQPAWIFLAATFPVLLSGIAEALSDFHNTPVQLMHNYYYGLTFFELFVLTIGLSIKFKNYQEERKKAVEEMLDREITAKEEERRRIALDLHDKLGGLVSAAKLNFNASKETSKIETKDKTYNKGMEILDTTAQTIRELAHNYTSSSMLKVGIVQALKELYINAQNPSIFINQINFEKRLDPQTEHTLFMLVQEAITNAVKHAKANEVLVFFNEKNEQISVTIEDDGIGFDSQNITEGLGLKNMFFRVKEQLKGNISIESNLNKGTTIIIKFYRNG